ncbi:MAG: S8 family serine peptidase [Verrucomicrobiae bacterium]|nr:S8 family serine peptidase [Verrucomicrobiae bacterium]
MKRASPFLVAAGLMLMAWVLWQVWPGRSGAIARASHAGAQTHHPGTSATQGAIPATTPVTPRPAAEDPRFPHRLSNTDKSIDTLARQDHALLLRNALLDTTQPLALPIPPVLKAGGEPGAFIVQARRQADDRFIALLKTAGVEPVSYIPNQAWLVRGDAAAAGRLENHPEVQAVTPYEPYYKLEEELLAGALAAAPLPRDMTLHVVLFPGTEAPGREALNRLGASIVREQRTPFGPQMTVQLPSERLTEVARLPEVQAIEKARARKRANDLARVTVSVAPDSTTSPNYFGLTGAGVTVGINDTGVDASHPALQGRVFGATVDTDGHGTHVAGSIAGNGSGSPSAPPPGSTNGAIMRGMAPAARLYAQYALFDYYSDTLLQENTARTNILISNNSWYYEDAYSYNFASASFDAATRDALPGQPGDQPVLFVFAAGNDGFGTPDGKGGGAGSILSPATAKNVITVGSLEQKRFITNQVVWNDETNRLWLGHTDSAVEVAAHSSRGNVAPGQEGEHGRFKPDVVAPGEFVVSCRASGWQTPTNPGSGFVNNFYNVTIPAGATNEFSIGVPDSATRLRIRIVPSPYSPNPMPALPIFVNRGTNTTPADYRGVNDVTVTVSGGAGQYFYAIGNPTLYPVTFDLTVVVGTAVDFGTYYQELALLNAALGDLYRYESGTSMAAAMVSGILALMQEYFEKTLHRTNSPALMKALIINGARSLPDYDLNTRSFINYQGWGVVNLTNSIPSVPAALFDQATNRILTTGDSQARTVTLSAAAQTQPLRITLAWTDPPGNPVASVKLVNDLDLIVSNNITHQVYFGNNFEPDNDFTTPVVATNQAGSNVLAALQADYVNNVENVIIREPTGGSFTVIVRARRVNVNAVTSFTNGIGQDYALVISSDARHDANAIQVTEAAIVPDPAPIVIGLTNSQALMRQRIGAHPPLAASTNGVVNQWNFYVFTNSAVGTNAAGTNLAFLTFIPPNLGRPRALDADIDLYVSTDSSLTNLNPAAIAAALKSTRRGGNEVIVITNAPEGQVFYVGVKSEDQQAAEYGLFASSSNNPFSQRDEEGNLIVQGLSVNVEVPDGMPDDPQGAMVFAIATEPITIRRVVVTNVITHENLGDLIGILSHAGEAGDEFVVLNNHTFGDEMVPPSPVTYTFIYDDSDEGDIDNSRYTQGPGSLRDFIGDEGQGMWILTMVDNALHHTGVVNSLTLRLEPAMEMTNDLGYTYTDFWVQPGAYHYEPINVPPGVTNVSFTVSIIEGPNVAFDLYVRRGAPPTLLDYDKSLSITPPGGQMDLSIYDSPPLTSGLWVAGVYNPSPSRIKVRLGIALGRNLNADPFQAYLPGISRALMDDVTTNSQVYVPQNRLVADVMVDVRLDHPRVADLVLTLVSPSQTRIVLMENRGGPLASNIGSGYLVTNYLAPQQFWDTPDPITNIITITQTVGTLKIDYDFFDIPDSLRVYYGGRLIFDSGFINGTGTLLVDYGPGADTNLMVIMNQESGNLGTAWIYTPTVMSGRYYYLSFTENTNLTTTPIKFQPPPFDSTMIQDTNGIPVTNRLFVLPEESLNQLIGETSQGFWRLEIWDRLGGNPVTDATLLDWRLNLAFVNTNALANALTNGVPITATVIGGQTLYFVVDVPSVATLATNVLTTVSGDGLLDLLFNQIGIPDTNTPGSVVLLNDVQSGAAILDALGFSTPQIIPGLRYYLGVRNETPGTTNTFTLMVGFNLPVLTSGGPPASGILGPGTLTYYEVTLPPDASAGVFTLWPLDGNVDLLVSRSPAYPTPGSFDYSSVSAGTNIEQIVVSNAPVAGKWNIAVYNPGAAPVSYMLQVSHLTGGFSSAPGLGYLLGFAAAPKVAAGNLVLEYLVGAGVPYVLETSSDLRNWQPVVQPLPRQVTPLPKAPWYRVFLNLPLPQSEPAEARARFYRLRTAAE